ncbi:MAG: Ig-like domain-containing protein [Candidatus Micrarchaeia archaeon]
MPKVVIVAPYYEIVTSLWNPFLKGWVKNELEKRGIGTILLWRDDANRQKLFQSVTDADVKGVLGAAHGWESGIVGQYDQVLIKVGDKIGPEWRKICLNMVSCLVARELIPWLVQQGVPSAIGEVTEYIFTAEDKPREGNNPEEDRLLKYYLYSEYTFWFAMAQGFTAEEAYKLMIKEYYRQSKLAESVDEETAYYVKYDANNRKFFGDGKFRLIEGIETQIQYDVITQRNAQDRFDSITISGKVIAQSGVPTGKIYIEVNDKNTETEVPLNNDGSFTVTFTFDWDKNVETTYQITLIYEGDLSNKFLPKLEETEVKIEPTYIPTKIEITDIKTSRDASIVTFNITGKLTDVKGNPIPNKIVEVYVGDGELYEETSKTDDKGIFTVTIEKSYPILQTKTTVIARFNGDDVYQSSSTTKIATFSPNWEVIRTIAGAITIVATAIAIILSLL